MNKFLSGLFAVLFTVSTAGAEVLSPIEKPGDATNGNLVINAGVTGYDNKMIAGGASLQGSATNNAVTVNTNLTDTNDDGKKPEKFYNHYTISSYPPGPDPPVIIYFLFL